METFEEKTTVTRKYDDAQLKSEVERIRRYYAEFMIEQALWMLKAEITHKKETNPSFTEGEFAVWDSQKRIPMGFSDWRQLCYDSIEEARRYLPSLLEEPKLFEPVECRPRHASGHRLLFHRHREDCCTLSSRLSDDGKRYMTMLYDAAAEAGITLSMRYHWEYRFGAAEEGSRTEQLHVPGGFDVEWEFLADCDTPLSQVRDAVLVIQIYYRLQ